ncbi:MAG: hypothetical protein LAQ69_04490 [Acidobacteriia bacterium]|nr:hypothetical protein [Terriglobia bacterium]
MDRLRSVTIYQTVMGISIVLNILVGIFILFAPDTFAALLGQPRPSPETWPRHWGAQLIAINLLYLPGLSDPIRNRFVNYLGILIRLSFALFFFTQGRGFVTMGIYDGTFGLSLLATYLRVPRVTPPSSAATRSSP